MVDRYEPTVPTSRFQQSLRVTCAVTDANQVHHSSAGLYSREGAQQQKRPFQDVWQIQQPKSRQPNVSLGQVNDQQYLTRHQRPDHLDEPQNSSKQLQQRGYIQQNGLLRARPVSGEANSQAMMRPYSQQPEFSCTAETTTRFVAFPIMPHHYAVQLGLQANMTISVFLEVNGVLLPDLHERLLSRKEPRSSETDRGFTMKSIHFPGAPQSHLCVHGWKRVAKSNEQKQLPGFVCMIRHRSQLDSPWQTSCEEVSDCVLLVPCIHYPVERSRTYTSHSCIVCFDDCHGMSYPCFSDRGVKSAKTNK